MIFPFRLKSKVFEERHIAPTRQRLRELGSLVCFLQDSLADDSLNLTALIDKFYFRLVVKAIRVTCLEKNLNQKCLQTCYSLDDCVDILIVTAIEKDDEDLLDLPAQVIYEHLKFILHFCINDILVLNLRLIDLTEAKCSL